MGLSLLRNKYENTFIKAVASALVKEKKVVLTHSDYTKVTQDDVKIALAQFRYIKIQPKTIDLSTRLVGITTEFVGIIPTSLVLRSIVLG